MFPTATVVAAIDDTHEAVETLSVARSMLSHEVPSVLHVLHVVEELPSAFERYLFPYACFGDDQDALIADVLGASRRSLQARFSGLGLLDERFLSVVYGRVAEASLEKFRVTGPDLVVVGAGSGERSEFGLIGKNASRLIRHSPVPVLMVRRDGSTRRTSNRMLVGLDLGPDSPGLFSDAIRFAHTHGASLTPVHVVPSSGGRGRGTLDGSARKELDRRFQQVLASLKLPYPVQTVATDLVEKPRLESGDAGEQLVSAVRELDAALVILYRCHSSAGSGARLGRVAEYVLRHAPCDVLVLPPPIRQEAG